MEKEHSEHADTQSRDPNTALQPSAGKIETRTMDGTESEEAAVLSLRASNLAERLPGQALYLLYCVLCDTRLHPRNRTLRPCDLLKFDAKVGQEAFG